MTYTYRALSDQEMVLIILIALGMLGALLTWWLSRTGKP